MPRTVATTTSVPLDELLEFQLNAASASFQSLEDREDLIERIVAGFERG